MLIKESAILHKGIIIKIMKNVYINIGLKTLCYKVPTWELKLGEKISLQFDSQIWLIYMIFNQKNLINMSQLYVLLF